MSESTKPLKIKNVFRHRSGSSLVELRCETPDSPVIAVGFREFIPGFDRPVIYDFELFQLKPEDRRSIWNEILSVLEYRGETEPVHLNFSEVEFEFHPALYEERDRSKHEVVIRFPNISKQITVTGNKSLSNLMLFFVRACVHSYYCRNKLGVQK